MLALRRIYAALGSKGLFLILQLERTKGFGIALV